MTTEEKAKERMVSYQTALGRSCDDRTPTKEQMDAASREADEHVQRCEEAE